VFKKARGALGDPHLPPFDRARTNRRAATLYETRASGLGADFIRQVERKLAHVVVHQTPGDLFVSSMIRRRLEQRFPFGVVIFIISPFLRPLPRDSID
jgi:hypothetical protein